MACLASQAGQPGCGIWVKNMDPISLLQRHLILYSKSLADSLYAIEHSSSISSADYASLRDGVLSAADELDRLVQTVPDYAALVGPRDTLLSRVSNYNSQIDTMAKNLGQGVEDAEAKLQGATTLLEKVLTSFNGKVEGK